MSNDHIGGRKHTPIARRRFVQAIGAAGLAATLAGCAEGEPAGEEQDAEGRYFRVPEWEQPDQLQYNPYNPTQYGFDVMQMATDQLFQYNPPEDEFIPQLAEDWEVDDDGLRLHLSEDHVWHDGDAFTAEDVYTKLRLDYHEGGGSTGIWRYVPDDGVDIEDDHTLYFEFDGEVNPALFENVLFELEIETKADIYDEYLDPLEEAGLDGDGHDEALAELLEFGPEEPVGVGPFAFSEANPEAVYLDTFEDYPLTDEINFDGYAFYHYPDNESRWQGFIEDELDGFSTLFVPEHVLENFPDYVMEKLIPADEGLAIYFQFDNEQFEDLRVRQAIAYAIDEESVAENAGGHIYEGVTHPTGLASIHEEEYLEDVLDEFTDYSHDTSRAAELLEEAGYERDDDDLWVDEEGEQLSAEVRGPAGFSDWIDGLETVAQNLESFGLDAELVARDDSAYWADDWDGGDFEIAADFYGATGHPYEAWEGQVVGAIPNNNTDAPSSFEVPALDDPDGDAVEFDFDEALGELERLHDEDEERELIQEIAFAYNQALPIVPVAEKWDQAIMTEHDWDIPDEDDPIMEIPFPAWYLVREGELRLSE
jgi:peptide/nickel transport system substrate-binding protein